MHCLYINNHFWGFFAGLARRIFSSKANTYKRTPPASKGSRSAPTTPDMEDKVTTGIVMEDNQLLGGFDGMFNPLSGDTEDGGSFGNPLAGGSDSDADAPSAAGRRSGSSAAAGDGDRPTAEPTVTWTSSPWQPAGAAAARGNLGDYGESRTAIKDGFSAMRLDAEAHSTARKAEVYLGGEKENEA